MRTQCPNPKCKLVFDVPEDRAGKNGPCPDCGQVITFRSLEVIRAVERERERREKIGQQHGGPLPDPARPAPFNALLEDIRSLWNVGSIFRTADGAGFGQLFLCGITGCPPRKEIAKTSLGAEDHLAWAYQAGALEVLPPLKAAGVLIVGLECTETSEPLETALGRGAIKAPLCLVVGNEVSGISAETLAACDLVCHLPMRGIKQSLNVAVAFGIGAYLLAERVAR
jgi:tRNA G18 (ribose-2'-O)-methylase SpoU